MRAAFVLPKINGGICNGCGDCVHVCHADALAIQELKAVIVNEGDCDFCTDCEAVCPVSAIACPFEVVLSAAADRTRNPVPTAPADLLFVLTRRDAT
jgi:MinD superfamily P-loop ATPase